MRRTLRWLRHGTLVLLFSACVLDPQPDLPGRRAAQPDLPVPSDTGSPAGTPGADPVSEPPGERPDMEASAGDGAAGAGGDDGASGAGGSADSP
ncbi:MAG: hypothetical protein DIU78_010970 [Pseudomonadota bacterium]